MYILAIETTGPQCSVALVSGDAAGRSSESSGSGPDGGRCSGLGPDGGCRVLGMESSAEALSHLRDLVPLTENLLSRLNVAKSALSHIAVSAGPGSFTGIRIGVTTARALGQALNLPVIAVPTLDAFAYKEGVCTEAGGSANPVGTGGAAGDANPVGTSEPVVCAILNARRGQVYGKIEGWLPGCPCMLTDVLEIMKSAEGPVKKAGRPVLFFGDGIDAYEGRILDELGEAGMELGREFFFTPKEIRYQSADAVGRLAFRLVQAGAGSHYGDVHPDYMRKAEAEQKLEAGELPICKLPKQE